jgi:hypothetical protein
MFDTQLSGNSSCTTTWILGHHIQNHLFECAVDPYPIVVLVGRCQSSCHLAGKTHITVWMAACWIPFCISPGCSIGPVTTSTKDQVHITVFVQREVHFTHPFFLMSNCHRTTAWYNSKTTTVRWVLITVDCGIAGSYLRISCAVRHVIWPLVLSQRH